MKCVVKIMAMPGPRAAVADFCVFRLTVCDDGGPGFVNVSESKCTGTHWHARVDTEDTIGRRNMGAPSRQSNRGATEKGQSRSWRCVEKKREREDANRICSVIHEHAENKGLSLVEAEIA